jgi:hypothetical protein
VVLQRRDWVGWRQHDVLLLRVGSGRFDSACRGVDGSQLYIELSAPDRSAHGFLTILSANGNNLVKSLEYFEIGKTSL